MLCFHVYVCVCACVCVSTVTILDRKSWINQELAKLKQNAANGLINKTGAPRFARRQSLVFATLVAACCPKLSNS